jgi:hypothetical protein
MNVGNNAAANRTRQNKVVYLNRNFLLASGIQAFYTHTSRSGACSCVPQRLDHVSLVRAARAADALIVLSFRPGQFDGPSSTRSGSSQDRRHPRLPDSIRSAVCEAFLRLGHMVVNPSLDRCVHVRSYRAEGNLNRKK